MKGSCIVFFILRYHSLCAFSKSRILSFIWSSLCSICYYDTSVATLALATYFYYQLQFGTFFPSIWFSYDSSDGATMCVKNFTSLLTDFFWITCKIPSLILAECIPSQYTYLGSSFLTLSQFAVRFFLVHLT